MRLVVPVVLLYGLVGCDAPWGALQGSGTAARIGPVNVQTTEPVIGRVTLADAGDGEQGCHAPTITALSTGDLLAAWYAYDGPGELDGADIHVARRLRDSEAWSTPELVIDRREAVGNPVLYSEGEEVWLFFAVVPGSGWSTSRIEFVRSPDGGHTWGEPEVVAGPLGANVKYPPVRLESGELLLPAYSDLIVRSLFYVSTDGERWLLRSDLSTPAPHANLQPAVVQLADGRLLSVMRNAGGGWLWWAVSDDGGRRWSQPMDSGFPNPGSPAALARLRSGNLALVFNDSEAERRPLSITISADEGQTWHPPRVLADGPGELAYPAITQTPDGVVHIVYSHDRERIEHLALNEAWIVDGD